MSTQRPQLSQQIIDDLVMHPDFPNLLAFIEEHFENSTDIQGINVDNPSTTVHAEVIATQKIDKDIRALHEMFQNLRQRQSQPRKKGYE